MARNCTTSGGNKYLSLSSAIVSGGPVTFACWFNAGDTTNAQQLMALANSSAAQPVIGLQASGNIGGDPVRMLATDGTNANIAATSAGFSASVWNHAAGTANASGHVAAYLNGGSAGSDSSGGTVSNTGLSTTGVGALTRSSVLVSANVSIAWAGVWNVELSASEIAHLAAGYHPEMVRPDALADSWDIYGNSSPEPGSRGNALTLTSTPAKVAQPRITLPARPRLFIPAAAVGGFQPAWAVNATRTISGGMSL